MILDLVRGLGFQDPIIALGTCDSEPRLPHSGESQQRKEQNVRFRDRVDARRRLADRLRCLRGAQVIVVGMARGGDRTRHAAVSGGAVLWSAEKVERS